MLPPVTDFFRTASTDLEPALNEVGTGACFSFFLYFSDCACLLLDQAEHTKLLSPPWTLVSYRIVLALGECRVCYWVAMDRSSGFRRCWEWNWNSSRWMCFPGSVVRDEPISPAVVRRRSAVVHGKLLSSVSVVSSGLRLPFNTTHYTQLSKRKCRHDTASPGSG